MARKPARRRKKPGPKPRDTPANPKQRFTVLIPGPLADDVRDAVVALYPALGWSIADFAEAAFRDKLAELRREHNRGRRFAQRKAPPKQGRPFKPR